MKTYSIPLSWESYTRIEVNADSLQEAVNKAIDMFLSIPDENYLDGPFVDSITLDEEFPDESYDAKY